MSSIALALALALALSAAAVDMVSTDAAQALVEKAAAQKDKEACEKAVEELLKRHGASMTGAWAAATFAGGRWEARVYVPAPFSISMNGGERVQEFVYRGRLGDGKPTEGRLVTTHGSPKGLPAKRAERQACAAAPDR